MPLVFFYTAWKYQKTFGFVMFSGGTERNWLIMSLYIPLKDIFLLYFLASAYKAEFHFVYCLEMF